MDNILLDNQSEEKYALIAEFQVAGLRQVEH